MGFVRRRARRRTALVVGGAAYAAGRRRRGQDDPDQEAYDDDSQASAPTDQSADELERLAALHANGSLTDEEFAAAKAKILGT